MKCSLTFALLWRQRLGGILFSLSQNFLSKKILSHSLFKFISFYTVFYSIFSVTFATLQNMRSHKKCNACCRHKKRSFCTEQFFFVEFFQLEGLLKLSWNTWSHCNILKHSDHQQMFLAFIKTKQKPNPQSPQGVRLCYCSSISDASQEIPDNTNYWVTTC